MNTKLRRYIQLAGEAAVGVAKPKKWVGFLGTMSRIYRYPFPDQLMIHAQRPKVTACASYEIWNRRMRRYIRRGSKGIGLIRVSNGYPRLHYVFDVADTGEKEGACTPWIWKYQDRYRDTVTKALEERFGVPGSYSLADQLQRTAGKLADDYWQDHHKDIVYECEGSRLEGLDEFSIGSKFKVMAAVSVSYVLINRCGLGLEHSFVPDDFTDVLDFNTQRIVKILGTAVSQASEQVLRTIAVVIYNYEYKGQTAQNTSQTAQPQSNDKGNPSAEDKEQPAKPSVREVYDRYKAIIKRLVLSDMAYKNACVNSDKQNAVQESIEAVKRAALSVEDKEFMKLFYDMAEFRSRLQREVFDETYPELSAAKGPEPSEKKDNFSESQ